MNTEDDMMKIILTCTTQSFIYLSFNLLSVSGSVMVTMKVAGNTTTVDEAVTALCDAITGGTTFTYNGMTFTLMSWMQVDGYSYYGVSCGDTTTVGTYVKFKLSSCIYNGIIFPSLNPAKIFQFIFR